MPSYLSPTMRPAAIQIPPHDIFEPRTGSEDCAGHFCECGRVRLAHTPVSRTPEFLEPPPVLRTRPQADLDMSHISHISHISRPRTLSFESSAEDPPPSHLYFDQYGRTITRDEWVDYNWSVGIPALKNITVQNPLALLAYFDFVKSHNDTCSYDDRILLPSIGPEMRGFIESHSSLSPSNIYYSPEIRRLRAYLDDLYED